MIATTFYIDGIRVRNSDLAEFSNALPDFRMKFEPDGPDFTVVNLWNFAYKKPNLSEMREILDIISKYDVPK